VIVVTTVIEQSATVPGMLWKNVLGWEGGINHTGSDNRRTGQY